MLWQDMFLGVGRGDEFYVGLCGLFVALILLKKKIIRSIIYPFKYHFDRTRHGRVCIRILYWFSVGSTTSDWLDLSRHS